MNVTGPKKLPPKKLNLETHNKNSIMNKPVIHNFAKCNNKNCKIFAVKHCFKSQDQLQTLWLVGIKK